MRERLLNNFDDFHRLAGNVASRMGDVLAVDNARSFDLTASFVVTA